MLSVLRASWPLLLGVMLLMIGNGMQGTLLGIRGGHEGMSATEMSFVTSAYFGGFLVGSITASKLIKRVGHVRVFAALGSLISAILVLYAASPNWPSWVLLRFLIGFSYCGVYITAESWMNSSATNETRGQALSAYMIVQMMGIVIGQGLITLGDPAGWMLFVIPSVLVSLAFTPILLTSGPAPAFETLKGMSIRRLFEISPLGCIGLFLMGGVFSSLFAMASVWGTQKGLSVAEISAYVAAIYIGGLLFQFPVGWLSDRNDRRQVLLMLAVIGTVATIIVLIQNPGIWGLLLAAAIVGGVCNPAYSLLLAHTNDYLDNSDMAAASAGLLFLNGVGSIIGPLAVGWLMSVSGPDGYWMWIGSLLGILAIYTAYRMTRRAPVSNSGFAAVVPGTTPLAVEVVLVEAQSDDHPSPA